jgi:hypothetical protein
MTYGPIEIDYLLLQRKDTGSNPVPRSNGVSLMVKRKNTRFQQHVRFNL